jgi:hypothetical protein
MIFEDNKKDIYIGKNVRARIFFKDQKENFEIHSDYKDGNKLLEFHQKMSYGEGAENFVYGNFEVVYTLLKETEMYFDAINKGEETNWKYILQSCTKVISWHPYFIFVKQAAFELFQREKERIQKNELIDVYVLSKFIPIYQSMKEDLFQFISVCLNPKIEPDFSEIYKFISLGEEKKLLLGDELAYGKVVSEIQALVDSYVLEEDDVPFGIVSPLVRLRKGNRPMAVVEVLYPDTVIDLHKFIMAQYLQMNIKFKTCKSCSSYFAVMGNSKAEYCNRLMAGSEKTCRQAGSMRIYQSKKLKDPINQAYTKAYKTRNARIRYGRMTREEFENWSAEAREYRDKCLAGLLDFSEFEKWLSK